MKTFTMLLMLTHLLHAVTFEVSDVKVSKEPLPIINSDYLLKMNFGHLVEASSFSHENNLIGDTNHPVLFAAHYAFAEHRPLVLSPDTIWLMILQGLSAHIQSNPEKFRDKLVNFQGKRELIVERNGFVKGGLNDWKDVVREFEVKIDSADKSRELFVPKFSTTTDNILTAYRVNHMAAVSHFYSFTLITACGIPQITLNGTTEDWEKIVLKIDELNQFEMKDWVKTLKPILQEFVNASKGQVNKKFWQSLYKFNSTCQGTEVTGWILNFFPFDKNNKAREMVTFDKDFNLKQNQKISYKSDFPKGLTRVDFKWIYFGKKFDMQFNAGFIGVLQDSKTMALEPNIGWVVSEKFNENLEENDVPIWLKTHLIFLSEDQINNDILKEAWSLEEIYLETDNDADFTYLQDKILLKKISIFSQKLSGNFLKYLANLPNLESIDDFEWNIKDEQLEHVSQLKIKQLYLNENSNKKILNYLPKSLQYLKLDSFDFSENAVLNSIQFIDFKEVTIYGVDSIPIQFLKELKTDKLILNKVSNLTDEHLKTLLKNPHLKHLEITSCELKQFPKIDINQNLSTNPSNNNQLQYLDLDNNDLTSFEISSNSLTVLSVRHNQLKDIHLQTPHLTELYLANNKFETIPILTSLPKLECLSFGYNPLIENFLNQNFPTELKYLNLDNIFLTEANKKILSEFRNINELSLENSNISSTDSWIFDKMSNLQTLNLSKNKDLENEEAVQWLEKMSSKGISINLNETTINNLKKE